MSEKTTKKNDTGSILPPLTKDNLPKPIADFLADHPIFVRLYVPLIVTISLIIQLILPIGRCRG